MNLPSKIYTEKEHDPSQVVVEARRLGTGGRSGSGGRDSFGTSWAGFLSPWVWLAWGGSGTSF